MGGHREIERKFDATAQMDTPDLADLPGVAGIETAEHELCATYYDTPDLRLARHTITLRRREGGDDAGWHLKLPGVAGERVEIHYSLARARRSVPLALRRLVTGVVHEEPLVAVVEMRTHRRAVRLLGGEGAELATLCDDHVTTRRLGPDGDAEPEVWREFEVELGPAGDEAFLALAGGALLAAGAKPSASASKLARALGVGADRGPLPARSAGRALLDYLGEHVARLHALDPLVRADAEDAVHQMRVTARRLRSSLTAFRPLFLEGSTEALRADLRWVGEVLGAARDAEVAREHLLALLAAEPPGAGVRAARRVVRRAYGVAGRRSAHAEGVAAMSSSRYRDLLDGLQALISEPPFTDVAWGPAQAALAPSLARTWRRTRRRATTALAMEPGPQRLTALHETRKAAKRARYAAEAVTLVYGRPAARFAGEMKRVQTVLGDLQDTAVIRADLARLAALPDAAGARYTLGRLHGHEDVRAAQCEADFVGVWARASDPSLRTWFTPNST